MQTTPNTPNPWKLGLFYYSPTDERLWVPKRVPVLGYTINFAHRYAFIFGLMILGVIAWAIYVAVRG